MKKLLKVIIPPFIGFLLYSAIINHTSLSFKFHLNEIGGGELHSLMLYYRYTLPLLLTVGILTQLLVIVPIWDNAWVSTTGNKVNALIDLLFVCLVFALGISYVIWDTSMGVARFFKLVEFMGSIQLVYWIINIVILYIIERIYNFATKK